MGEGQIVNLTTSLTNKKNQVNQKGKMYTKPVIKKESQCFFCKRRDMRHMKKDYTKFKNWLVKKGTYFALFVMNLI